MSGSVKLVHRTSKTNAKGEAPVYLRITIEGKSTFVSTGVAISPRHWNAAKEEVRSSHSIADALNLKVRGLVFNAQAELMGGRSAKQIKLAINGVGGDFCTFFESYIADLVRSERFWEARKFQTTLNKCKECWGASLSWSQVSPENLRKLENYLDQKKKNSVNTRRKEISRVRRLVRMAIRKGDVPISKDPFLIYQLPKGQKVERRKLSLEEIKKLEEVSLDSFASLARDAFLLSFYGAGIRFGDLCLLKSNNVKDGRLLYRAAKTKKLISIPLPLQATKILQRYSVHDMSEDYIIPLMAGLDVSTETNLKARISSRNAQVNTYLKRIAKKAGLDSEGLSMHVARHSYADYARRSSGNIHAIMQALGHSDIRVTQTYLKSFDSDAVDEMTRTMWE